MAADLLPAAQYLRMSTEHQQYSLENRSTAIQNYANCYGFEIVETYGVSPTSQRSAQSSCRLRRE